MGLAQTFRAKCEKAHAEPPHIIFFCGAVQLDCQHPFMKIRQFREKRFFGDVVVIEKAIVSVIANHQNVRPVLCGFPQEPYKGVRFFRCG